ncbi:MAG: 2'-deoxycytidine 5'-triphosphate deaminase [Alphaproteobacteria bacterium]|nr:2'-deoxycytidine 5'-triphosphate deaminase [Alphaproteobacteria bacterium]
MTDPAQQEILPLLDDQPESQTGVWPAQWIKGAIERGLILADEMVQPNQIQPASLDLRLGCHAYLVPASFLPGLNWTVEEKLRDFSTEKIDLEDGAVLETGKVYIVPLQEHLRLKKRMSAVANPKSSTGRLDVFARVITDNGCEFDSIRERYAGRLWLEIAPRSFNVKVRTGSRLAQVRVKSGRPPSSDASVKRLHEEVRLVHDKDGEANVKGGAIALSVDVVGDPVTGIIGYKAKQTADFIDIDLVNHYDGDNFWDTVYRPDNGGIILKTDEFHILATKESLIVPPNFAADMVAYDTLVGEFRAHYAGFFDPGFGYADRGPVGAKIVLEFRSHDVPFLVEHGQIAGRVVYERLSVETDKPYGAGIGSSYQGQALSLGKQFKR